MKATVHFVIEDPNQAGELRELWRQILMEKLQERWNISGITP